MKKTIIANLFISVLLVVPLLIKTLGVVSRLNDMLVSGLTPLLIFLIIFNSIGLICLKTVSKYSQFIDTKDLLDHCNDERKIEENIYFRIYRVIVLSTLFILLFLNKMFLTTIFACIWWFSRHIFKTQFDYFVKNLE